MIPCLQQYLINHGNDDEDFDEWADQLEALGEISQQNIHHEMMGRSSGCHQKDHQKY